MLLIQIFVVVVALAILCLPIYSILHPDAGPESEMWTMVIGISLGIIAVVTALIAVMANASDPVGSQGMIMGVVSFIGYVVVYWVIIGLCILVDRYKYSRS